MNVIELKQHIKEIVAEIKTIKTQLSQDHSTVPEAWRLQSHLQTIRGKIRAYYYLYAFLRGKSAERVEVGGKLNHMYSVQWYSKKLLPVEAHGLFDEWLSAVK